MTQKAQSVVGLTNTVYKDTIFKLYANLKSSKFKLPGTCRFPWRMTERSDMEQLFWENCLPAGDRVFLSFIIFLCELI